MSLWIDLKGPILADTVYIDGKLVAKDVTITLPAVTPVTADFKAMGTYTARQIPQPAGDRIKNRDSCRKQKQAQQHTAVRAGAQPFSCPDGRHVRGRLRLRRRKILPDAACIPRHGSAGVRPALL